MNQIKTEKKERKLPSISWLIMWLLTGIVIFMMALGMSMSDSRSLTNSLNFGEVRDIKDVANHRIRVGEQNMGRLGYTESRSFDISLMGDSAKWNYLYFDIDSLDVETLQCRLTFRNSANSQTAYTMLATMEEGVNRIALPGLEFGHIILEIEAPEKCELLLANVQVREKDRIPVETNDILFACIAFLIYTGICLILYTILKKKNLNYYILIEILQDIYISVGNAFLWVPKKFSDRFRRVTRTILIMVWMSYMMMMANYGKYYSVRYYKYNLIICVVIILLIAVLMIEQNLRRILWKKQIVFCWLFTSVLMCISEFFFAKRFAVTGYVVVFVFGFLYLIWNNMDDQSAFIEDIMHALRGLLLISVIFCLFFRTYHELGGGYAGPTWNPNVFAMFLVPVLVAELTTLVKALKKNDKKKIFLLIIEIAICSSCNLLANSRIGLLAMVISFCIFILYLMRIRRAEHSLKRIVFIVFSLAVLIIPTCMGLQWGVTNIPKQVGHEIVFPADDFKFSETGELLTVHAAEVESSIDQMIYAPEVTSVLASRNLYWMGYLREMNFLGHEYAPRFWGAGRTSHNGILAVAYTYGVLIAVPYLFLFLNGMWESFRKVYSARGDRPYDFYLLGTMVAVFAFMMVENVERPFLATEWILFYLLLGALFPSGLSGENSSGLLNRTDV